MPGFTIHLAVGKRYIEKHKNKIKNENDFMKGTIAPDLDKEFSQIEKNKSKSHYGKWGQDNLITNIDEFLADKNIDINNDYWKGYFIHLLTDFYFYKKDFKFEHEQTIKNNDYFYYDYDCLNKILREKYNIDKYEIESIKKYMYVIEGKPKYLKIEKVINFIEKISDFDIKTEITIIKEKGMEGLK